MNVRVENDQLITDSRNVAEVFGKQHKHVLDSIRAIEKDVPNFRLMFFEGTMPDSYGREQRVYFMNRDGFTLLAMGFTGRDAMQWKLKYIDAFNRLEKAWNSPEAVMARALQYANNQLAAITQENKALQTENAQQRQMIGELRPKADYMDKILNNKGLVTISQIAKDYGMSGRTMNKKLHELGVQYKQSGQWLLYSKYHDKGYTHSRTINIIHSDGTPDATMETKWTQKGRVFIYELLKSVGVLPVIEQRTDRNTKERAE